MPHIKSALIKSAAILTIGASPLLSISIASAEENHHPKSITVTGGHQHHKGRADAHGPIGVMGEHLHPRGGWMLSYRYMQMGMKGNLIGDDNVSPEEIIATTPNRFFGTPMQPANLRVVPTEMRMEMHMLSAMFAPTDNITLMTMLPIVRKEMDHITFNGAGSARLGEFTTESNGIGDLGFGALIGLYDDGNTKIMLNAGVSVPTGSITKIDQVLAPNGMTPTLRLPYAMQLGTGTFDLLPGITIVSRLGDFTFGGQYKARLHTGDNDEGYSWGDKHELTGWLAYQWAPWISTSVRVAGMTQEEIDGIDTNIVAPVQTANPDFFGGERVDLLLGINLLGTSGPLKGHRLALEAGAPIYQDLNGPQMETDYLFTIGWQKAF